jgi:[FeFe] hydrogenase H-cluster maturation GTPase HydF
MQKTPKGLRLHIGIFGRRNAGKSSLLNIFTGQAVSIVSETAGTTTDPVEKPMELLPLGPVLFIDTAGIDDTGALGEKRIKKSIEVIKRTDVGIIVAEPGQWGRFEQELADKFLALEIPVIIALNKIDKKAPTAAELEILKQHCIALCPISALNNEGIIELRKAIIDTAPEEFFTSPAIVSDLVKPGGTAVLVVPIDKEAPKGRLILPQVQTIRDLLDGDAAAIICKERELKRMLDKLGFKPDIVVTDSQAFLKVAADTPNEIPMTSFSILFARLKANLVEMVRGAMEIERLGAGDKVLICESCTHHPITEDIGTVKIPRWLGQYVGGRLQIGHCRGADWPDNLSEYKLIIHCGGCMWNRRQMLSRTMEAKAAGVAMTNYGLTIAYTLGIFERALGPFPAAYQEYRLLRDKG